MTSLLWMGIYEWKRSDEYSAYINYIPSALKIVKEKSIFQGVRCTYRSSSQRRTRFLFQHTKKCTNMKISKWFSTFSRITSRIFSHCVERCLSRVLIHTLYIARRVNNRKCKKYCRRMKLSARGPGISDNITFVSRDIYIYIYGNARHVSVVCYSSISSTYQTVFRLSVYEIILNAECEN